MSLTGTRLSSGAGMKTTNLSSKGPSPPNLRSRPERYWLLVILLTCILSRSGAEKTESIVRVWRLTDVPPPTGPPANPPTGNDGRRDGTHPPTPSPAPTAAEGKPESQAPTRVTNDAEPPTKAPTEDGGNSPTSDGGNDLPTDPQPKPTHEPVVTPSPTANPAPSVAPTVAPPKTTNPPMMLPTVKLPTGDPPTSVLSPTNPITSPPSHDPVTPSPTKTAHNNPATSGGDEYGDFLPGGNALAAIGLILVAACLLYNVKKFLLKPNEGRSSGGVYQTISSTQDDDDGGDDDWGWDETPRTTRSSGSADLEMAQVKRKDSDDFSWNDDVGISSSSISDQPKASPVPPQSKRLQHRSRPSPPTRQAMPQTTPPAVSLERHHPLSSAISPTSSSSLPVAQPITQLGPSRKPAPKKKAPAAPRKEDDFFSEMGLSAKPTFAKKTPGSAKKVKKAAPAVSLALDDDDFGDDADWGDDADLDDLLG